MDGCAGWNGISQVFCKGNLIEHGKGLQPSSKVYEKALSD